MNFPQSSRGWQNYQHLIGGLYQILLMATGVFLGKGDWISSLILGILTFIVNRLSSEINYQVNLKIFEEHENVRQYKVLEK